MNIQDINLKSLQNATPNDLKLQGAAKLGTLIYNQGKIINQILTPQANKLLLQFQSFITCPTPLISDKIIIERNLLVNNLNTIGNNLNKLTKSLTGLDSFLILTSTILKTIKTTKTSLSLSSKFLPTVPGSVPSTISDLEDLKNSIIFTPTGTSKLDKIQSSINTANISVSIVNGYILDIVNILNNLDINIIKCSPNSTLAEISKDIKDSASTQKQSEENIQNTAYKGFIIEIEEVPYTPTVNRRRAIGKNQQGIILIQTELSFTTNPLTLINELKIIIDRDNLKAY